VTKPSVKLLTTETIPLLSVVPEIWAPTLSTAVQVAPTVAALNSPREWFAVFELLLQPTKAATDNANTLPRNTFFRPNIKISPNSFSICLHNNNFLMATKQANTQLGA
jgi:hypothetical protein